MRLIHVTCCCDSVPREWLSDSNYKIHRNAENNTWLFVCILWLENSEQITNSKKIINLNLLNSKLKLLFYVCFAKCIKKLWYSQKGRCCNDNKLLYYFQFIKKLIAQKQRYDHN